MNDLSRCVYSNFAEATWADFLFGRYAHRWLAEGYPMVKKQSGLLHRLALRGQRIKILIKKRGQIDDDSRGDQCQGVPRVVVLVLVFRLSSRRSPGAGGVRICLRLGFPTFVRVSVGAPFR